MGRGWRGLLDWAKRVVASLKTGHYILEWWSG
jgi:hypothetical protein